MSSPIGKTSLALHTKQLTDALPYAPRERADSSLLRPQNAHSASKSKALFILKAEQQTRKFRGTSAPDPTLGISMDDFTSFTQYLASSKRIFALLGAGLSASSGPVTFRGNNRHWRDIEPQDLSNIDGFWKDPVKVWWLFSDRMKRAQEAEPNHAHVALTKLAREKDGFFAVNQSINGEKSLCEYKASIAYPVNEGLTITTDINVIILCVSASFILDEATPSAVTEAIHKFTLAGPIDVMPVVGTSAVVLPNAMYIHVARNSGARVAYFNLEECEDELGRVRASDWMFKGGAAEMVLEYLKVVVGNVIGM